MPNTDQQIHGVKIKQIFLLIIIVAFLLLIGFNLSMFIPSLLGALTLYIVCRDFNFYLQEKRNWKPVWSSLFIIFLSLVTLIIPIYLIADMIIERIGDSKTYMEKLNQFFHKIHEYIYSKTSIDILNKEYTGKLTEIIGGYSTSALSGTVNTLSVIGSLFFILYFMLEKPKLFERLAVSAMPLKRANINLIGVKFRKLVMANAVGIPVVAIGQGIVAMIGYFIFGAPSVMLLFALTAITSMIPIVGGAIVFVPVCIFMIAQGDTFGGVGLLIYCMVVVGLTDNILRFTLLKKLEDIHPLNTIFGIIMGLNLFGFIGLVFGPILVSMTVLLIQIYRDEFSDDDTPELELPQPKELEKKIDLSI